MSMELEAMCYAEYRYQVEGHDDTLSIVIPFLAEAADDPESMQEVRAFADETVAELCPGKIRTLQNLTVYSEDDVPLHVRMAMTPAEGGA